MQGNGHHLHHRRQQQKKSATVISSPSSSSVASPPLSPPLPPPPPPPPLLDDEEQQQVEAAAHQPLHKVLKRSPAKAWDAQQVQQLASEKEEEDARVQLLRQPVAEDEDIDASASAFIRRFHHQLHLQRLASLENYRQMLARGL